MNTTSTLNTAWMLKCGIEGAAFDWSSRRVARTQERLLYRVLAVNRRTWFGIRHGFDQIGTLHAYQKRVPPATYADFDALIQLHRRGRRQRPDRGTRHFAGTDERHDWGREADPVHGRPAPPVSARRCRLDRRPVLPATFRPPRPCLLVDLARTGPAAHELRRSADRFCRRRGISRPAGALRLRRLLVVPGAVARLHDMTTFRYCTLLFLLAAEDLSLISIWNPTFLLALVSSLTPSYERLCDDLSRGRIDPPVLAAAALGGDPARRVAADAAPGCNPGRHRRLRRIAR